MIAGISRDWVITGSNAPGQKEEIDLTNMHSGMGSEVLSGSDREFLLNAEKPSNQHTFYSLRKLFAGFINAALIVWKLTVNKVINNAPPLAAANIHQLGVVRYS